MHADTAHPRWRERLGSCGVRAHRRPGQGRRRRTTASCRPARSARWSPTATASWRAIGENPEANAETLRGGWLHTGDLGSMDEDGLPDAARPLEGHDHLRRQQHLPARDRGGAAAPPRPGRGLGRRPAAPRLGRGGRRLCRREARARSVEEAALDRLCLDHIARFKRPREYRFVEALPKNNYGKVLRGSFHNY